MLFRFLFVSGLDDWNAGDPVAYTLTEHEYKNLSCDNMPDHVGPVVVKWYVRTDVPNSDAQDQQAIGMDGDRLYVDSTGKYCPQMFLGIGLFLHSQRQNVTTFMVGLKKKGQMCRNITPRMVNPRDIAGNAEEEEKRLFLHFVRCLTMEGPDGHSGSSSSLS